VILEQGLHCLSHRLPHLGSFGPAPVRGAAEEGALFRGVVIPVRSAPGLLYPAMGLYELVIQETFNLPVGDSDIQDLAPVLIGNRIAPAGHIDMAVVSHLSPVPGGWLKGVSGQRLQGWLLQRQEYLQGALAGSAMDPAVPLP